MHIQSLMHPVMVLCYCNLQSTVRNTCTGYSFLPYVLNIYGLTCVSIFSVTYGHIMCIKWVNMVFTDTKLKFQSTNSVCCTYQLYCPCQMHYMNGTHATTIVDLCLCCIVAVLSIGRTIAGVLYSRKPLFLTIPDPNPNFFGK
jgi:hypothetical protein